MALKLAKENRFDLILTDIQMPEMNGIELCELICSQSVNARTPVIFVTSLNDFASQCSPPGAATDFIAKPILLVELAVKALTCLLKAAAPPV
jgi:CheY-like chemotaxis protein